MSNFNKPTVNPPGFYEVLGLLKTSIFAYLNCVQIGKIAKVTNGEQTVEVELQIKRIISEKEIKSYPILVDVPFFVLQGGGAFIDLPIEKGDNCLVIFNDRDIEDWWLGEAIKEPKTPRMHALSDGFALVGINSKDRALNTDGTKVVLNFTNKDIEMPGNSLKLLGGTDFAVSYNNLLIEFNELKGKLNAVINTFNFHNHPTAPSGPVSGPSGTSSISNADITTTKVDEVNLP